MLKLPQNSRFSARKGTRVIFIWLFFYFLLSLYSSAQTSFVQTATVTSDKKDYAPRSNAVFTGAGFSPGETVVLKVKNLNQPCLTVNPDSSYLPWSVVADTSGSFVTNWTVCDCFGDSLRLRATGQNSGLVSYVYFSDAHSITSITPNIGLTIGGESITITGKSFFPNNGGNTTYSRKAYFGTSLLNRVEATITSGSTSGNGSNEVSTLVVNTPILISGLYNVYVDVIATKTSGQGTTVTTETAVLASSYTVNKAVPVVSVTVASSYTYNGLAQGATAGGATGVGGSTDALTPAVIFEYEANNNGSWRAITGAPTDAGNYRVRSYFAGNTNYINGLSDWVTFTIGKAASVTTVTINGSTFTYTGSAIEPATVTVTGPGLSLTPTASYSNNINAGTATASYSYAGDANHEASSDSKTFAIIKAPSTTTVTIIGGPFTYTGAAYTPATVSVTGTGGLNLTPTAIYTDNLNAGTATTSYNYVGDANHLPSSDSKTFTISKADQTITWANPANIVYGTALSGIQLNATVAGVLNGTAAGALTYTSPAGTMLNAGTYSLTVDAAETPNYKPASKTVSLEVDKAVLTVTADNKSKVYGEANPTFTASYNGFKNGETLATSGVTGAPSLTTTATNNSAVGSYPITAVVGTLAADNYTFSYLDGTLTVNKADLTVVNTDRSKTYGDVLANADFTGSISGVVADDNITVTRSSLGAGPSASVNTYTIIGTLVDPGNRLGNYNVSNLDGTLTVNKRAITITVDTKNKTYGDNDPLFTAQANNVVNNDTPSGILLRTAGEDVGTYAISKNTYTYGSNYAETFVGANFTIIAKAITVKANDRSKTYGDVLVLGTTAFTIDASTPMVTGESIVSVTLASAGAVASAVVGTYDIVPSAAVAGANTDLNNYAITYSNGILTVNKATPLVTLTIGGPFTYTGSAQGASVATIKGVNNEELGIVTYTGTNGTTYTNSTAPTNAGSYNVAVSFVGNANYNPASQNADFTINKANAIINVTGYNGIYDGIAHGATGDATGVQGENLNGLVLGASFTYVPGGTAIWVFTDITGNYNNATNIANIVINKAALTVVNTDRSKTYGDVLANADFTGSISGVVAGDNITVTRSSLGAGATASVNTYVIVGTLVDPGNRLGNYNVSNLDGTLTVNKRAITITADAKNKIYGDNDPVLTAKVTYGTILGNDAFTGSLSRAAGENVGAYAISKNTYTYGSNYAETFVGDDLTIGKATITVTANDKDVQYSDIVNFDAKFEGFQFNDTKSVITGTPTFSITNGQILFPAGFYTIIPSVSNLTAANYTFTAANGKLTVIKEDADVVYTGSEFFAANSAGTADVDFMATVMDVNDFSNQRGNISNAKIDFKPTDAANSPVLTNLVTNYTNIPVALVNPSDLAVGIARSGVMRVTLTPNEISQGGKSIMVSAKTVDAYYNGSTRTQALNTLSISTSNSTNDEAKTLITIAVPGQDYITGGGHLVISNTAAGTCAASSGSKMNFGFTMKWNKTGKNVQGQANIIFRKCINGVWKTYHIKSNSISSLNTTNGTNGREACIIGKANLTDFTNPQAPVSLGGALDFTMKVFESSNQNNPGQFSISVYNGSQLLFCNNWVSPKAEMAPIAGGNIRIQNASTSLSVRMANPTSEDRKQNSIKFESYPNPFNKDTNIRFALKKDQMYELAVYDIRGTLIKKVASGLAEAEKVYEYKLDDKWLNDGIYFVRLISETGVQTLKTVKKRY